jgi:hypothetical protein
MNERSLSAAYNTQSAVPDGYEANPLLSVKECTVCSSYRPLSQFFLNADFQTRNRALGSEPANNFGTVAA